MATSVSVDPRVTPVLPRRQLTSDRLAHHHRPRIPCAAGSAGSRSPVRRHWAENTLGVTQSGPDPSQLIHLPKMLRITVLSVLAALFAQTAAATTATEIIRDSVSTARYVPAIPSELGQDWIQWQKGTDDLIGIIAGNIKNTASAVDIEYEARRAGLDGSLVFAMVEVLSAFDAYQEKSQRNQGLLQLDPALSLRYGSKENTLFQSKYNLRLGCVLFRNYLDQAHGDVIKALLRFLSEASPQVEPLSVAGAILRQWQVRAQQLQKNRPAKQ